MTDFHQYLCPKKEYHTYDNTSCRCKLCGLVIQLGHIDVCKGLGHKPLYTKYLELVKSYTQWALFLYIFLFQKAITKFFSLRPSFCLHVSVFFYSGSSVIHFHITCISLLASTLTIYCKHFDVDSTIYFKIVSHYTYLCPTTLQFCLWAKSRRRALPSGIAKPAQTEKCLLLLRAYKNMRQRRHKLSRR